MICWVSCRRPMGLQSGVPLVALQSPFHAPVGLSWALQEGGSLHLPCRVLPQSSAVLTEFSC